MTPTWLLSDVGGWVVSECLDVQSLFFLFGFVLWPDMLSQTWIYYDSLQEGYSKYQKGDFSSSTIAFYKKSIFIF